MPGIRSKRKTKPSPSPAPSSASPPSAAPAKPARKITWQQRLDAFEKNATVRLVKLLASTFAFLVLVGTAFQLLDDLRAREQDRVDAALTRIQIRSGGNTGKALAINTLIDANRPISNLNFSCERIGDWSDREQTCRSPVIFEGLDLRMPQKPFSLFSANRIEAFLGGPVREPLSNIDFSNGVFDGLGADNLTMKGVKFAGAVFRDSSLAGSEIEGEFQGAVFERVDLSGAILRGDTSDAKFDGVDMSAALIEGLDTLPADNLVDVFAWADLPPVRYARTTPEGYYYTKDGNITDYPPATPDVLRRVVFCATPMQGGRPTPLAERKREGCQRLSFEDAMKEINARYGTI